VSTVESIIWPPIQTDDIVEAFNQPTPLSSALALILLVPNLAVTSRRFQDAGWSGKLLWLWLLPLVALVMATLSLLSYLESVAIPSINDAAVIAAYFVPTILLAFAIQVFFLILCLLPSKSKDQGNRFAD
jgi:uncharacterized membrane protein YhaH (DUF805 family)